MFGGYRSDEIVFGFPMDTFVKLTEALTEDSIIKALCGCIMDDLPAHVVDNILALGFTKGTDHFSEGLVMRSSGFIFQRAMTVRAYPSHCMCL